MTKKFFFPFAIGGAIIGTGITATQPARIAINAAGNTTTIFNFFLKKFSLKFPSIFLKYPLNYNNYNDHNNLINYILKNLSKNVNHFFVIVKYNKYLFLKVFYFEQGMHSDTHFLGFAKLQGKKTRLMK